MIWRFSRFPLRQPYPVISERLFLHMILKKENGCSMDQLIPPSTPAGVVIFAHLQKVSLELLCFILEALSEGANQTRCTVFVLHQLNGVPWKWHAGRETVYFFYALQHNRHRWTYAPLTLELAWTNILRASFLSSTVSRRRRKLWAPLSLTVE